MEDIIRKYFELLNSEQFDKLLELWDENGEFHMPFRGTLKGKDQINEFYSSLPSFYPEHHDGIVKYVISGNEAVLKIDVKNRTRDGKLINFTAFSWMTVENNKIRSMEAKFDTAMVLKALKG